MLVAAIFGGKMHKEMLAVGGGVAVVILLRNMLARTINPLLAAVKITWPT